MQEIRKAIAPSVVALVAVILSWTLTGQLNAQELGIAVSGLVTSLAVFYTPNTPADPHE